MQRPEEDSGGHQGRSRRSEEVLETAQSEIAGGGRDGGGGGSGGSGLTFSHIL